MKKLISLLLIVSFISIPASTTFAGQREWATAGKILTGVLGGLFIFKGISEASKQEQPVREVVYREAPSGHYETRTKVLDDQVWVPGHYETRSRVVQEKVWVPDY